MEDQADHQLFDLFVVGGGINGCGIAREAAGSGLSVCLAEMNDLASATSSGSTKLIHGGLRYLEHYDFSLVRKALTEREVLWSIAPHITRPLRFVLPHHTGLRPAWILRLGLFIYDHLGGRKLLPGTQAVNFKKDETGKPLLPQFKKGFEYSDCWVDDARLVVLNALDAAEHSAKIMTNTKVIDAQNIDGLWQISTLSDDGTKHTYLAKLLVNATGPWVDRFLTHSLDSHDHKKVRLVRGSHIVIPKLYKHDRCYILQNKDGRVFFTIPYEENFTLIGTTDCEYDDEPGKVTISSSEIEYLCDSIRGYFKKDVHSSDVVWSYSAVRPLIEDSEKSAQAVTRDYQIHVQQNPNEASLINIYGGKITTYRKLSQAVLVEIAKLIPLRKHYSSESHPLPGGDFAIKDFEQLVSNIRQRYPFLTTQHSRRLIRLYGTRGYDILGNSDSYEQLGQNFGSDLYEAEVRYLIDQEWARNDEDILWRRTKLGLHIDSAGVDKLKHYVHQVL